MEGDEGHAIPLIMYQEREGFKITQEGLALLNSIDKKVGVISVAGKYRTGKSYLLNKIILNLKTQGFGVGPSINPCTKGIWIYSKPIDFKTSDGEDIALLILDSEGLGAFDEDANHDTRIFMLAVLLSSYFIYNSVGSIDENALNNISLIVNLTKNLQIRSSDSDLDVDELANYFPSFLWVIRDFSLQLIDSSGNSITSKEYLENSLLPQKGMSDAIETKNRIRKLLKHFFKDRDCFALVRPSEDEKILQSLQNISEDALRPEFIRQVGQLRKNIMRKVKGKTLNNKPITGKMLAGIAASYVEAINKGAVPTIEGAWQSVVTAECNKQIELLTSEYDRKLKSMISKDPLSQSDLKKIHKQLKEEAENLFKEKALGEDLTPYTQALKKKIQERFDLVNAQNERKLLEKCQEQCQELSVEFEDKLKQGNYTDFQVFKRDFEKRSAELKKNMPVGEATELKLKELSSTLLTEAAEYISRAAIMEHINSNRRLSHQLEFVKSTFDAKKEEFGKEKDYYKNKLQELETENYKLKAKVVGAEMRLEELKTEKERLNSTHQERLETLKDDFKDRFNEFKQKYEQTLELYQDLQKKYNTDINKLQKELALVKQESEWKTRENDELKIRRNEIESEYKEMRSQLKRLHEDIENKEDTIKNVKGSSKILSEPSVEWINERNLMKNQIESLKSQIEENKSVKEALVTALQSRNLETRIEPKDPTKHLSIALEKTEQRCQELEQKLERLRKFEKIFKGSNSIQCKLCGKTFNSNVFSAHISVCEQQFIRTSETGEYIIIITQILSKEDALDSKSSTEYLISVTYKGRSWNISRYFKNFKHLETSLHKELSHADIPDSSQLFPSQTGSIFSNKFQVRTEERKKRFQDYLTALASDPDIKNSSSFRKFLNTDQYFPEEMVEQPLTKRNLDLKNSISRKSDFYNEDD